MACYARFPGDADIDGTGVYIAFFVPGVFTAVTMMVHASVPLTTFRDSFEAWRYAEAPERYSHRPDFTLLHHHRVWMHYFTSHLLGSLSDLQCITGLGIVVAGIVQLDTASFYHLTMIQNYWNITFIAMWTVEVLLSDRLERPPSTAGKHNTEMLRSRGIFGKILDGQSFGRAYEKTFNRGLLGDLLTISGLVMSVYFQSSAFRRLNSEWDEATSGRCYRDADRSSDSSFYFWMVGLGTFTLEKIICLQPTAKSLLHTGYYWFGLQERRLVSTIRSLRERLDNVQLAKSALHWFFHLVSLCSTLTALTVFWALRQFLALWALGNGTICFVTSVYLGFFLWSAYDVLEVPVVNRDLIQRENKWGFGQVLPLVLMLSLIVFTVDASAAAGRRCLQIKRSKMHDDEDESDSVSIESTGGTSSATVVVRGKVFAKPYFGLELSRAVEDYTRGNHRGRVTNVHALWYSAVV